MSQLRVCPLLTPQRISECWKVMTASDIEAFRVDIDPKVKFMNFMRRGSLKFMNISAIGELKVSLFASPAGLEGGRYVHEHFVYVHEP